MAGKLHWQLTINPWLVSLVLNLAFLLWLQLVCSVGLFSRLDMILTLYSDSAGKANADFSSRFPYNLRLMMIWIQMNTVCATTADELPFTAGEIAEGTKKDTLLVKVYECTSFGWPGSCPSPELKPFWNRRDEILSWGRRVIIPFKFQKRLFEELNECDPGMCRMKALARPFV